MHPNGLLFISLQVFHFGRKHWEPLLPRESYPLKRGEGRDIDASTGVMDVGWEGGGSSSAHCSCAKARGW